MVKVNTLQKNLNNYLTQLWNSY